MISSGSGGGGEGAQPTDWTPPREEWLFIGREVPRSAAVSCSPRRPFRSLFVAVLRGWARVTDRKNNVSRAVTLCWTRYFPQLEMHQHIALQRQCLSKKSCISSNCTLFRINREFTYCLKRRRPEHNRFGIQITKFNFGPTQMSELFADRAQRERER